VNRGTSEQRSAAMGTSSEQSLQLAGWGRDGNEKRCVVKRWPGREATGKQRRRPDSQGAGEVQPRDRLKLKGTGAAPEDEG